MGLSAAVRAHVLRGRLLHAIAAKRTAARVRRIGHERVDAAVGKIAEHVERVAADDAPRGLAADHLLDRAFDRGHALTQPLFVAVASPVP
jgi:hypothetical protein